MTVARSRRRCSSYQLLLCFALLGCGATYVSFHVYIANSMHQASRREDGASLPILMEWKDRRVATANQSLPDVQQSPPEELLPKNQESPAEQIEQPTAPFASGEETWLDAIVSLQWPKAANNNASKIASRLNVVHPLQWRDESIQNLRTCGKSEIMHARWTPGSGRFYGVEDKAVSPSDGGKTVFGNWPDTISNLVYIAILKNGHTHLMNTVGDLRQRLDGASTLLKGSLGAPVMFEAHRRQTEDTHEHGQIVFAVVREPVDRFLSSTCQDMSMSLTKKLRMGCWPDDPRQTLEVSAHDLVDCAIARIREAFQFSCHQFPQVSQLIRGLSGYDLGVTLVPQEEAFESLVFELGGINKKIRDRTSDKAYQKSSDLKKVCELTPANLTEHQIAAICDIYEGDLKMMEYGGIDVSLCRQVQSVPRNETWTKVKWRAAGLRSLRKVEYTAMDPVASAPDGRADHVAPDSMITRWIPRRVRNGD